MGVNDGHAGKMVGLISARGPSGVHHVKDEIEQKENQKIEHRNRNGRNEFTLSLASSINC